MTRYFFVEGIDFKKFAKGLSENYSSLKIGGENSVYEVGNSIIVLVPVHKAILIKGYENGLDKKLETEFDCKLN